MIFLNGFYFVLIELHLKTIFSFTELQAFHNWLILLSTYFLFLSIISIKLFKQHISLVSSSFYSLILIFLQFCDIFYIYILLLLLLKPIIFRFSLIYRFWSTKPFFVLLVGNKSSDNSRSFIFLSGFYVIFVVLSFTCLTIQSMTIKITLVI